MTDPSGAVVEAVGLAKRYGLNYALEPLDLRIRHGTIHGFLGKNGAGKSTLVGMIAGSIAPSAGMILHGGVDITATSYAQRRAAGIHLLSQHAEPVPELSVAENLLMPDLPRGPIRLVDWRRVREETQRVLDRFGLAFDSRWPAGRLSLHDQRRLMIARALREGGSLAMLDEPTASLSRKERRQLFDWISELNDHGQTFVFISHYNSEIQQICDECTVFRDGRLVARDVDPRSTSSSEISTLVTGQAVTEFHRRPVEQSDRHISLINYHAPGVGPVDLEIARGHITGFVGLPGSGAKELARSLGGLNPPTAGSVLVDGSAVKLGSVRTARRSGVGYLTDDRIHEGLVPQSSLLDSLHLGSWPTRRGLIDRARMRDNLERLNCTLAIRARDESQPVGELSGGNQQKVLLGSLLGLDLRLVILDEPTVGVDVGTKEEINALMNTLADAGLTIIVISYDIDELCRTVDSIVCFQDGKIAGVMTGVSLNPGAVIEGLDEQIGGKQ